MRRMPARASCPRLCTTLAAAVAAGLCTGVLLALPAAGAGQTPSPPPPAGEVTEAIERARSGGQPFELLVHCNEKGARSLDLFPSGVAIWSGDTQVTVPPPVRRDLLEMLLDAGFPSMAASYGGEPEPQAGEPAPAAPGAGAGSDTGSGAGSGSDPASGPLYVGCRVKFDSGEVSKTTIQQLKGEKNEAFVTLAETLLDRVEPLARKSGIGAEDLADGLAKLAAGTLAPETFYLRFVRLPPETSDQAGTVVQVERGTLTRRAYAPGREVGRPTREELTADRLATLAESLREARVSTLPPNLWAADRIELEVRVFSHGKTVVARSFRGRSAEDGGEAQERFDALVDALAEELLRD